MPGPAPPRFGKRGRGQGESNVRLGSSDGSQHQSEPQRPSSALRALAIQRSRNSSMAAPSSSPNVSPMPTSAEKSMSALGENLSQPFFGQLNEAVFFPHPASTLRLTSVRVCPLGFSTRTHQSSTSGHSIRHLGNPNSSVFFRGFRIPALVKVATESHRIARKQTPGSSRRSLNARSGPSPRQLLCLITSNSSCRTVGFSGAARTTDHFKNVSSRPPLQPMVLPLHRMLNAQRLWS